MNKKMIAAVITATMLIISTVAAFAGSTQDEEAVGAVYTMTNDATKNEVVIFNRDEDGILTKTKSMLTGGKGSGPQPPNPGGLDSLASQGSLVLTGDQRWLLAVNAGSNEISVFQVLPDGLALVTKVDSGGPYPVSLTILDNLVYVLNAGPAPNITGFILGHKGELRPLPNSTRSLNGVSRDFAQVGFDPEGETLVVTDKALGEILVYSVGDNGLPAMKPFISQSAGKGPFGFIFDKKGHLLVVEVGSNAVSSYNILNDGTLQVISPSVANGQAASCWIAGNERGYIFTANPGIPSISSYKLKIGNGKLSLLNGTAEKGETPLDISVVEGRFLYALDPPSGGIDMFKIEHDGSLTNLGSVAGGLPTFAQGIAAH